MARKHLNTSSDNRTFVKLASEGDKVEGVWRGMSEGKYGDVGTVFDPNEAKEFSFAINAALRDLAHIPEGSYLWIEFAGWDETKNGTAFKTFDVDFDDEYGKGAEGRLEQLKEPHREPSDPKARKVEIVDVGLAKRDFVEPDRPAPFEATDDDVPF